MNKIGFILSTGRTGTQFFRDYISDNSENTLCLHEPKPSRRFKFLSNMYLQNKTSEKFVSKVFAKSRKSVLRNDDLDYYIESNNFAFGIIPCLKNDFEEIKILHLIRNPLNYIQSHLNHGFWSGHKRFFAKYIPYWLENLDIDQKHKNDAIVILIERWAYVNNQIASYEKSNPYLLIHFEDLFSKEMSLASSKLKIINSFFNIDLNDDEKLIEYLKSPKNKSKKQIDKFKIEDWHIDYLKNKHADILQKFNYKI